MILILIKLYIDWSINCMLFNVSLAILPLYQSVTMTSEGLQHFVLFGCYMYDVWGGRGSSLVPHLLWHGGGIFGQPHIVVMYDKPGVYMY